MQDSLNLEAKDVLGKRLSEDLSPKAIALYDFEPMDETELRFKVRSAFCINDDMMWMYLVD